MSFCRGRIHAARDERRKRQGRIYATPTMGAAMTPVGNCERGGGGNDLFHHTAQAATTPHPE